MKRVLTIYIPIILILTFALFPYAWGFVSSITPEGEMYVDGLRYVPRNPTADNYIRLFSRINFIENLTDSFLVASFSTLFGLTFSVTASYSFSRFRFRGRRYLLLQFLLINMFPVVLLLIPLFVIFSRLKIMDTYPALVLAYSTVTIPFAVWMMSSFFSAIPRQLDEAAMIDGCGRTGTLLRVVLPIAVPGIAATGIYIFITAWNEFVFASVMTSRNVRTIPIALQNMVGEFQISWGLLTAGGVVSAVPVVILFFFVQRSLIAGMTAGAVKG